MGPALFALDESKLKIVSLASKVGSALMINRDVPIKSTLLARPTMTNWLSLTGAPKSNSTQVPSVGSVVKGADTAPCDWLANSAVPVSNKFSAVKVALNGRADAVTTGLGTGSAVEGVAMARTHRAVNRKWTDGDSKIEKWRLIRFPGYLKELHADTISLSTMIARHHARHRSLSRRRKSLGRSRSGQKRLVFCS